MNIKERIARSIVLFGCGLSLWAMLCFATTFALEFFNLRPPDTLKACTIFGGFVASPIILVGLVLTLAGPVTVTRKGLWVALLLFGLISTGFVSCAWYLLAGMAGH